jgi:hypothetical protein
LRFPPFMFPSFWLFKKSIWKLSRTIVFEILRLWQTYLLITKADDPPKQACVRVLHKFTFVFVCVPLKQETEARVAMVSRSARIALY